MILTPVMPVKFQQSFISSLLHSGKVQRSHMLWLTIFLSATVLQAFGLEDSLRFNRDLVQQGDVWLLFSAHFVHLNWSHWALNMAGLAIVAFFFSNHAGVRQWLAVILISSCIINAGIWWWITDIRYYVGLSGVLHGLFLYGALREIRYYPVSGYVLVAVLLVKLTWEFFYGALPGSEDMAGGRVLTEAHLLGAIGGISVWLLETAMHILKKH